MNFNDKNSKKYLGLLTTVAFLGKPEFKFIHPRFSEQVVAETLVNYPTQLSNEYQYIRSESVSELIETDLNTENNLQRSRKSLNSWYPTNSVQSIQYINSSIGYSTNNIINPSLRSYVLQENDDGSITLFNRKTIFSEQYSIELKDNHVGELVVEISDKKDFRKNNEQSTISFQEKKNRPRLMVDQNGELTTENLELIQSSDLYSNNNSDLLEYCYEQLPEEIKQKININTKILNILEYLDDALILQVDIHGDLTEIEAVKCYPDTSTNSGYDMNNTVFDDRYIRVSGNSIFLDNMEQYGWY